MGVLENDQKYIICLYEIAKGSKKNLYLWAISPNPLSPHSFTQLGICLQ